MSRVWTVAKYVFLTWALAPVRYAYSQTLTSQPIMWLSPEDCPAPVSQLTALVNASEKHPLWGTVTLAKQPPGWHARIQLRETPETSSVATPERTLQGNTCEEVTEAALLVISIMQRELEQEEPAALEDVSPSAGDAPLAAAVPAPAAAPQEAPVVEAPAAGAAVAKPPDGSHTAEPELTATAPPSATVGAGVAWSFWNSRFPTAGAVVTGGYHFGRFAIRAQLGGATSVNLLPTSEAVRVKLTTYDAALRACGAIVSGFDVCAGPTLQRIDVVGRQVDTPTRSNAWFPGFAAAMLGSQQQEGFGLWGELGVQFRFRQIALDLAPRGEIATIDRHTLYVWLGPQWRWR